jgi:hypothetical protein
VAALGQPGPDESEPRRRRYVRQAGQVGRSSWDVILRVTDELGSLRQIRSLRRISEGSREQGELQGLIRGASPVDINIHRASTLRVHRRSLSRYVGVNLRRLGLPRSGSGLGKPPLPTGRSRRCRSRYDRRRYASAVRCRRSALPGHAPRSSALRGRERRG